MTTARSRLVYDGERGVYHCTVRCVRRAFLCGVDAYSGNDYTHRKEWIRSRLEMLSGEFGVDVFAYSVMSNHMHIVLRTRPDSAKEWSAEEVARRWLTVYTPRHGPPGKDAVYEVRDSDVRCILEDPERVEVLRERLGSLSWFMKALNEHIARLANREDKCKGKFWESRFKCQRIVDDAGLLACMCYVDLNPIRAKLAESLEDSEFTSIFDRIMAKKAEKRSNLLKNEAKRPEMTREELENECKSLEIMKKRAEMLVKFDGEDRPFAHITEEQYFKIADWTGRQIREGKPGSISPEILPILESLELDAMEWTNTVEAYSKRFCLVAGTIENIRKAAEKVGKCWLKGCRSGSAAFMKPKEAEMAPA